MFTPNTIFKSCIGGHFVQVGSLALGDPSLTLEMADSSLGYKAILRPNGDPLRHGETSASIHQHAFEQGKFTMPEVAFELRYLWPQQERKRTRYV